MQFFSYISIFINTELIFEEIMFKTDLSVNAFLLISNNLCPALKKQLFSNKSIFIYTELIFGEKQHVTNVICITNDV